ncbi:MAG: 4Fe-4S dicluster domain-containing protein [Chitinivibrionales bacterium]|nr:4Fe-4S dicluster domain-containing protein [Chitinivibrionales bacterium]
MHVADGREDVRRVVSICNGDSCQSKDGNATLANLFQSIKDHDLADKVIITRTRCQGQCEVGPVMHVYPENVTYVNLTRDKIERIVDEHFGRNKVVGDYISVTPRVTNRFIPFFGDVHFYGKQLRMTLRNCGVIDPESIEEYLLVRGYEAAARVIGDMTPQQVIEKVKTSVLRGRGGGGFPTATKWDLAAKQSAKEKYVICNADEGDPGAFMDRSTIEGDPHTVLEGMIISGYAIGACKGFIYTRIEYPLAIERLNKAIDEAHKKGFLGANVFGSGWDFDIEVRIGAGAFVCGEETALIKSIEGYRGEPVQKPPFPTVSGLWEKPTVINNVETYANLPVIMLDGEDWFAAIGTGKSKGTKVFALAGKVKHTGLIEVPMGTTLREVIYDIGGGIPDGKKFKAVQTGGPAGGCLPEQYLDTEVDYDSLTSAGSIMGSGGMIVMDEDTCMVSLARYFMEFMVEESCGQCTPCRAGTFIILDILNDIVKGKATLNDLKKLEDACSVTTKASLCGLGKCAPNPVLSTIKHFRDEYIEHIVDKKCRANECKGLVTYEIISDKCIGCKACARKCPVNCITGFRKEPHFIHQEVCIKCGTCYEVCKFDAIKIA